MKPHAFWLAACAASLACQDGSRERAETERTGASESVIVSEGSERAATNSESVLDEGGGRATGESGGVRFIIETVASGLTVPWGIAFAPNGRIFFTERPGRIRLIEKGELKGDPWATLPVASVGEAGLMGIVLAPDFARSRQVYVVGTFRSDGDLVSRVIRLTERDGSGGEQVIVVDGIPAGQFHAGAAIAFGPDGMLYVATGDARKPSRASDRSSLGGKILRYRADGSVPDDNPIPNSPVYALGVRNVQGLAWDPETGQLFATDHGPSGFPNERFRDGHDELNAIRPGGDYGWPRAAGTDGEGDYLAPLAEWNPAIAPSGLALYTGPEFPAWRGSLFVGALRGAQLRRVSVTRDPATPAGWRAAEQEVVTGRFGRIRAVVMGADGHLYFTTSNRDGRANGAPDDDRILRIVSAGIK